MDWLVNNWFVVVGILVLIVCAGFAVYHFLGLPTDKQISSIKEWLKYAVTMSEKELGAKTGQLKLRMVYDLFVSKFPTVAKIVTFDTFSNWVDDALVWLNKQLEDNEQIKTVVKGETTTD